MSTLNRFIVDRWLISEQRVMVDVVDAQRWAISENGDLVFYRSFGIGSDTVPRPIVAYARGAWERVQLDESYAEERQCSPADNSARG